MNRTSQRDANESEIVKALRAAGAAVQQLDGAGIPDLLVSYNGVLSLLEVKNPNAKGGGKYNTGAGCLTRSQVKWWDDWSKAKGKAPVVVYTAGEALAAIGAA